MKPEQLDQVIAASPELMREHLGELHERILEAAEQALEASQDKEDGGKPSVTVSLKLKINLGKSPITYAVKASVGVTYSAGGDEVFLPDPNQPDLFEPTRQEAK